MALSSVPEGSEDGRAFFQERLALFGKTFFLLMAAIGAVGALSVLVLFPGEGDRIKGPFHFMAVASVGALWLICRRGKRSLRALEMLDAGITFVSGLGIGQMVLVAPGALLPAVPAALGLTHLLVARAMI